jgi:hypothetical protein
MMLTTISDFSVGKNEFNLKGFGKEAFSAALSAAMAVAILMLWASPSAAQDYLTQTGNPTFTTAQPVELGFINLGNGNLHQTIPLGSFPQRGSLPFGGTCL